MVLLSPTDAESMPLRELSALNFLLADRASSLLNRVLAINHTASWFSRIRSKNSPPFQDRIRLGQLRLSFCVLQPGDFLVVPRLWYHFVASTDLSVSITFWSREPAAPAVVRSSQDVAHEGRSGESCIEMGPPVGPSGAFLRLLGSLPTSQIASLIPSLELMARMSLTCKGAHQIATTNGVWEALFCRAWGNAAADLVSQQSDGSAIVWMHGYRNLLEDVQSSLLAGLESRKAFANAVRSWAEKGLLGCQVDFASDKTSLTDILGQIGIHPVAEFLHKHQQMIECKQARSGRTFLCELLAECSDPSIADLMQAWTAMLAEQFRPLSLEAALRLWLMRLGGLPGESPKIDRLATAFAEVYVGEHPNGLHSSDSAFIFVYSLIMLSTDQHHPRFSRRMTAEEFVRSNSGIAGRDGALGEDLPRAYLVGVYESIGRHPLLSWVRYD